MQANKLMRFVRDLEDLSGLLEDDELEMYHRRFATQHLSQRGWTPEPRHTVGRVWQDHVVLGRIMQYDDHPIFRAAVLDNWEWMPLDPPQPVLNEHNLWEICYQMGFGTHKLLCECEQRTYRGKILTPNYLLNVYDKIPFGRRISVESRVKLRERSGQDMDLGTILYRFYTSKNELVAEAGLRVMCFPRELEELMRSVKNGDRCARKRLAEAAERTLEQKQMLGYQLPQHAADTLEQIRHGNIEEDKVYEIFDLW